MEADRAFEKMGDARLKNRVRLEADRELVALGFQELMKVRRGVCGVALEEAPLRRVTVARHHGLQNSPPAIGAVEITRIIVTVHF